MKYDFDTCVDRRNSGSIKWNVKDNELPMWIADMDFKAADEIREAMQKRLDHGVFGYTDIPEEWYDAVSGWWERRHHFKIEKEWLMFCTGVISAISSIVRKLTTVAENVVLQTPVYNTFFNSIYNNGRNILTSPLIYDGEKYYVDFDDLEKKLSDPQTTLMILCNPHNPIGKIWDRETLEKIGELCYKHNVIVVSDEIHCDVTDPGTEYIPFASVSDICRNNSVTCIAPTKAFNLAGLHTAAVYAANPAIRHRVNRGLNTDEVAEPNAFAITAAIAAFNEGEEWLDEVREYIYQNKKAVIAYASEHIPEIKIVPSQATYLLWLDCGKVCDDSVELAAFLREKTGLFVSDGAKYCGKTFLRWNIACPRATVCDGLKRLEAGVKLYISEKK